MSSFFSFLGSKNKKIEEPAPTAPVDQQQPNLSTTQSTTIQNDGSVETSKKPSPPELNNQTTAPTKKKFDFVKPKKLEHTQNISVPVLSTTTEIKVNIPIEEPTNSEVIASNNQETSYNNKVVYSNIEESSGKPSTKSSFGFLSKAKNSQSQPQIQPQTQTQAPVIEQPSHEKKYDDINSLFMNLSEPNYVSQDLNSTNQKSETLSVVSNIEKGKETTTVPVSNTQAAQAQPASTGFTFVKKATVQKEISDTVSLSDTKSSKNANEDYKKGSYPENQQSNNNKSIKSIDKYQQERDENIPKDEQLNVVKNLKPKKVPTSPNSLKKHCKTEIDRCQTQLNDIYTNINKLRNLIHEMANSIKIKEKDAEDISAQIGEAIEQDDFNLADELTNKQNKLKDQIENLTSKINIYNKDMIQLRERELLAYKSTLSSYSEVLISITKLKEFASKDLEENHNDNKHNLDQFKIKKLREKLENLAETIDTERDNLKIQEEGINNKIKSQSAEVFEELDVLIFEQKQTQDEIEELKRLLENKRQSLDEINSRIEEKENQIDAIRSNFKSDFKKLNADRNKLTDNEKSYQEQMNELDEMEKRLKEALRLNQEKTEALNLRLKEYTNDISKYSGQTSKFDEEIKTMSEAIKQENELKSQMYLLKMNYNQSKSNIESTLSDINLLEINSKKNESEIIGLDLKIPTLEEEKAKYVASKNFKEAGRVAGELKKIAEQKSQNLDRIATNKAKIIELKVQASENEVTAEAVNSEIEECEKLTDFITYENLLRYKSNLETLIQDLNSNPDSKSKSSALTPGLNLVLEEIKSLEFKDHILKKYIMVNTPISVIEISSEIERNEEAEPEEEAQAGESKLDEVHSNLVVEKLETGIVNVSFELFYNFRTMKQSSSIKISNNVNPQLKK